MEKLKLIRTKETGGEGEGQWGQVEEKGKGQTGREETAEEAKGQRGREKNREGEVEKGLRSRSGSFESCCSRRDTQPQRKTYGKDQITRSRASSRSGSPVVLLTRLESPNCPSRMEVTEESLKRARSSDLSGQSSEEETPKKVHAAPSRRGRGRPPTTGQYVGLRQAKEALIDAERRELELQAEKELMEEARKARARRDIRLFESLSTEVSDLDEDETAATLNSQIEESVGVILHVATASKNLKGGFVKLLKEQAAFIKEASAKLIGRTASEENSKLQAANARLQSELESLRRDMSALTERQKAIEAREESRRDIANPEADTPPSRDLQEEFIDRITRSIMIQVGGMVDAKVDAVKALLPPEKRLRPPLAADRALNTPEPIQPDPRPGPSREQLPGQSKEVDKKKKGGKSGNERKKKTAKENKTPAQTTEATEPRPAEEGWTTVQKKKRGRKGKGKEKVAEKAAPKGQKPRPKPAPKPRAPRSTAVVITLRPGASERGISYASVLAKAKSEIALPSIGIPGGVKLKSAMTGAKVLQIPGSSSGPQADLLANKLRETFAEEDVLISRPTKCAEMRMTGLDESVTKEEVVAAICRDTGCETGAVKTGDIRCNSSGLGSVWIRCPVAVAKKLDDRGKVLVGWVAARVKLLTSRPLRCFRCFELGHVRSQCKATVDRSSLCYRCCGEGHKSADCTKDPHCAVCAMAGRSANHRVGGKACSTPPNKTGRRSIRVQPTSTSTQANEAMEEETTRVQ